MKKVDIICSECGKKYELSRAVYDKKKYKNTCEQCLVSKKVKRECVNCGNSYSILLKTEDNRKNGCKQLCFKCSYNLTRYNDINKKSEEKMVDFTCEKCNRICNVLERHYIRKKNKNICASCSSKLNANNLSKQVKKFWTNLSSVDREAHIKKVAKKTNDKYKKDKDIMLKKRDNTCLNKYGVKNVMHNIEYANKSFKYKGFINDIPYQSSYEKIFINNCLEVGLKIKRGPTLKYKYKNIDRFYYVDFEITCSNNKKQLVEIKGNGNFYKKEVSNGKINCKIKSAEEYSKKNNYLQFLFLLEKQNEYKKILKEIMYENY